jgi:hypothetical protein
MENQLAFEETRAAAILAKTKAELKLQAAERRLKLSNKCIDLVTERMRLCGKRELNELEGNESLRGSEQGISEKGVAHVNIVTSTEMASVATQFEACLPSYRPLNPKV